MKSWKTTAAGVGLFLTALGPALTAQFDSDPATEPAWGTVVAALIAGLGFFFARDNNVSSEKAGAK